jgi:hypothetical protein
MKRFCAAGTLFLLLGGVAEIHLPTDVTAEAAVSRPPDGRAESLRNTLVNGLRATRDDEKRFIDHIVRFVVEDKLPESLVYASFRWARQQRPKYPFPYFKYAVRELAKRQGINI